MRWLRNRWRRDLAIHRERRAKRLRERKILCPRCGYDVTVPTGPRCPECGLEQDPAWRQGWLAAGSDARFNLWLICYFTLASLFAKSVLIGTAIGLFVVMSKAEGRGLISSTQERHLVLWPSMSVYVLAFITLLQLERVWRRRFVFGPRRRLIRFGIVTVAVVALVVVGMFLVTR